MLLLFYYITIFSRIILFVCVIIFPLFLTCRCFSSFDGRGYFVYIIDIDYFTKSSRLRLLLFLFLSVCHGKIGACLYLKVKDEYVYIVLHYDIYIKQVLYTFVCYLGWQVKQIGSDGVEGNLIVLSSVFYGQH